MDTIYAQVCNRIVRNTRMGFSLLCKFLIHYLHCNKTNKKKNSLPRHGGNKAHASQVLRRGTVPLRGVTWVILVLDGAHGGGSSGVAIGNSSSAGAGRSSRCGSRR